jgi:hypothetical protein
MEEIHEWGTNLFKKRTVATEFNVLSESDNRTIQNQRLLLHSCRICQNNVRPAEQRLKIKGRRCRQDGHIFSSTSVLDEPDPPSVRTFANDELDVWKHTNAVAECLR